MVGETSRDSGRLLLRTSRRSRSSQLGPSGSGVYTLFGLRGHTIDGLAMYQWNRPIRSMSLRTSDGEGHDHCDPIKDKGTVWTTMQPLGTTQRHEKQRFSESGKLPMMAEDDIGKQDGRDRQQRRWRKSGGNPVSQSGQQSQEHGKNGVILGTSELLEQCTGIGQPRQQWECTVLNLNWCAQVLNRDCY